MKPVMYITKNENEEEDFSAVLELAKALLNELENQPKSITQLYGVAHVHLGQMSKDVNEGNPSRLRAEILYIAVNFLWFYHFMPKLQLAFDDPYFRSFMELGQRKEAA